MESNILLNHLIVIPAKAGIQLIISVVNGRDRSLLVLPIRGN